MKIKLLLSFFFLIFIAQVSSAQEAQLSMREQFEAWKQEKITAAGKSMQPYFYFVATARKTEPEIAVIDLGIAGFKNKFEITVIPLKIEQTADGKTIRSKLTEAGRIKMNAGDKTTDTNFADPKMKIVVDAQANALEIQFKLDDDPTIRFTTVKLSETSETGKFIRIEERKTFQ